MTQTIDAIGALWIIRNAKWKHNFDCAGKDHNGKPV